MTDFSLENIIKELDTKIKEVITIKSVLTQHISATTKGYEQFKSYASTHLRQFIITQLQLYSNYFQTKTSQLLNFTCSRFRQLINEKQTYKKQSIKLQDEVIRQKNVINLMKQEVQDLMILLNTQKFTPKKQIPQPTEQPVRSSNQILYDTVGLEVIEEEPTQRTQMSSQRENLSLIKIQQKFDEKSIQSQSIEEFSLTQDKPRLLTDPNPHLKSIFIPEEQYNQLQTNFQNQQSFECENYQYLQSQLENIHSSELKEIHAKTQQRQQSQQIIFDGQFNEVDSERVFKKKNKQNQPKTKQFLEEFRKTFNKCLSSIHASKKHSTKSNHKVATNMQVTYGKNSTNSSNYASTKPKAKESGQKIEILLKNLDNSSKFTIGNKKIELKYEGDKRNGQRHGNGLLYYSNGLCYQGQFREGVRHGHGVLKFNHIEIYNGNWLHDEIEGQGKIRNCAIINKRKSMNIHESYLSKWVSYNGEFLSSRFEGQGTLFLQGGQKFVGKFIGGMACGEGVFYRKTGQVQIGIWKDNMMIEHFQN